MTKRKFTLLIFLLIALLLNSCSDIARITKKNVFKAIKEKNYNYISKTDYYDVKDRYKRTPLMLAIINQDIKMVKLLLKKGAKIKNRDVFGETPLLKAASTGNLDIVKVLVKNKANINEVSNFYWTPLMKAVYSENLDLVKYLVKNKANIHFSRPEERENALLLAAGGNRFSWIKIGNKYVSMILASSRYQYELEKKYKVKNNFGILRFSFINNLEIIKFLIKSGVDINYEDKYGNTALINSIKSENIESIKWLLQNGADVNLLSGSDYNKKTPLIEAAKLGNIDIVKLLLKNKADVTICNSSYYTPYIYSLIYNKPLVSKYLKPLPHRCSNKTGIELTSLVGDNYYRVLKKLDITHDFTNNDISYAIKKTIKKRKIKYLKLLIKNFPPSKSNTILKYALKYGNNKIINIILKEKFFLEKKDLIPFYKYKLKKITLEELKKEKLPNFIDKKEKITPLMLASRWNDLNLVSFIISNDKNSINKVDKNMKSAIFYSVENGENKVNDFLINKGAAVNTVTANKDNLIMYALKFGANEFAYKLVKKITNKHELMFENTDGWNLQGYSAKYDSYEILEYLFNQKIKYSSWDYPNKPLIQAIKHSTIKIVKLLLKNKAVLTETSDGLYPTIHAIKNNKYKILKLLLKNKASLNREDNRLWNSLFFSARYANKDIFKLVSSMNMDKNPKNGKNSNIFLVASLRKNNIEILQEIKKLKVVDVNEQNILGETALIVAVKNNRVENIKYLLSIGANPNLKDINGLDSFHYAKTRGYKDALDELNKYKVTIK